MASPIRQPRAAFTAIMPNFCQMFPKARNLARSADRELNYIRKNCQLCAWSVGTSLLPAELQREKFF